MMLDVVKFQPALLSVDDVLEVTAMDRGVDQWRRYTRARQVKWPGWKIHRPGSAMPICFASVIVWTENKNVAISDRFVCSILSLKQSTALAACVLRATTKKVVNFLLEKSASGDLAWGLSDLEMTWLLLITALAFAPDDLPYDLSDLEMTWLPWRPGTATGVDPVVNFGGISKPWRKQRPEDIENCLYRPSILNSSVTTNIPKC